MQILYQWIFAHLLADFGLQTSKMVQHKKRYKAKSWVLYAHCLLHGALIYLFSPDKTNWLIPVIVTVTHFAIDLWKIYQRDGPVWFIVDQTLHLTVLIALWLNWYQPAGWLQLQITTLVTDATLWLILSGYMFVIFPLAFIIGFATAKWRTEIEPGLGRSVISLNEAGKWIGIFERILVFTFVITSHMEGIGFLIAAKSILRFTDMKGNGIRKEAEYVLIGTLISFTCSILTGLLVNMVIR